MTASGVLSLPKLLLKQAALAHTTFDEYLVAVLVAASARIGGATLAMRNKVNLHLIKRHVNWRSYVVFVYIRDALEERLSVSKAVIITLFLELSHRLCDFDPCRQL